jgi:hypothetical protein
MLYDQSPSLERGFIDKTAVPILLELPPRIHADVPKTTAKVAEVFVEKTPP